MVTTFFRLLSSPRLLWVHKVAPDGNFAVGQAYAPNFAEAWGQSICSWIRVIVELGLYSSPFWIAYYNRRLEYLVSNPRLLVDFAVGLSCMYFFGVVLRAAGRVSSPVYCEFEQALRAANQSWNPKTKGVLRGYDFDFSAWPVEYEVPPELRSGRRFAQPPPFASVFEHLCRLPAFFLINTFGLKLIYPGSTRWFFQTLVGPVLTEQRARLVSGRGGERFKLKTADGNHIDAMFFDRRSSSLADSATRRRLVITCEGNAGFYEMGMLNVPLDAGYSVIGWNHPGFWGSTGSPLPSQDAHAADAVMQFAINKLGFEPSQISVYGWSIGGFTASWLGMNYPDIGALVLDATFDHVLPLAIPRMPAILEPVVRVAIRDNVNLAVSDQVRKYHGPVRFIRRTNDEMITTDDTNPTMSNRANNLLYDVLSSRYPKVFLGEYEKVALQAYMARERSRQEELLAEVSVDAAATKLASYIEANGKEFPMEIGEDYTREQRVEMVLFLANLYMTEFESTHCVQLPSDTFRAIMNSTL